MSSHHIVRENQEPALVVEDFQALSEEYLGQILEWSPTIITNEENFDYFLAQDIKLDVLYSNRIVDNQEETKQLIPKSNFVEDSLQYLIDSNYKAVNVLAKERSTIYLDFAKRINVVVFSEGIRYVTVQSSYEKWKIKGQSMFIDTSILKSFNGLQFIEGNIFEVEQDGFVTLEMNSNNFVFVGEEI
ncbi:hypothetical protein [Sphingobacterium bovistauri]|uniref:Thiamine pyrophosphokinase n=1 Tax=Sphingobacterium bovistauri TaxID=2781959 RepID=A0ABS7Z731_9SPHI|nr:hypothetical protein [Sphingobacterium bovistauri]MCA5005367.1 hypothetical protein [Sphingobacterium bovistauri]